MITQGTIVIILVLGILALVVPRKYLLMPFMIAACLVPADQRIIIFTLDFTALRILVVISILRLWGQGEIRIIKWNRFDQLVLLWVSVGTVIYIMQWQDTRAFIFKCGVLFDVLGLYWLFRQSVRSWSDIHFVFVVFAWCALIMLPFVLFEWVTGRNLFTLLGQVHTAVRHSGRYRCQGPFPHSIILGLFWANLMPIFIGLGVTLRRRWFFWSAAIASIFMVVATTSSTPIATLLEIVLLLSFFRYRHYGRKFVYCLCGMLAMLHLVMKAPVWHLISRINIIGGSTGHHRYKIIDNFIKHFSEWALLGTRSTVEWGYGMQDVTNQYVYEGVTGGLITLTIFVVLLVAAVQTVGAYSINTSQIKHRFLLWCICISILGHCMSFFGVSYFGQIRFLLFLTLGVVGLVYEMSNTELKLPQKKPRVIDVCGRRIHHYS